MVKMAVCMQNLDHRHAAVAHARQNPLGLVTRVNYHRCLCLWANDQIAVRFQRADGESLDY